MSKIDIEKRGQTYIVSLLIDDELFSQVPSVLKYQIPKIVALLLLESL